MTSEVTHFPRLGTPSQAELWGLLMLIAAGYEERAHLRRALASRVPIEQAKGILAERLGIGVEEAFDLLRSAARSSCMNLHALAGDVVTSPSTPPQVLSAIAKRGTPAGS
jgi:AmiR/NasT family two-component response regulator